MLNPMLASWLSRDGEKASGKVTVDSRHAKMNVLHLLGLGVNLAAER